MIAISVSKRQILMSYFHNLDENEKLLQLIETLESISSVWIFTVKYCMN